MNNPTKPATDTHRDIPAIDKAAARFLADPMSLVVDAAMEYAAADVAMTRDLGKRLDVLEAWQKSLDKTGTLVVLNEATRKAHNAPEGKHHAVVVAKSGGMMILAVPYATSLGNLELGDCVALKLAGVEPQGLNALHVPVSSLVNPG